MVNEKQDNEKQVAQFLEGVRDEQKRLDCLTVQKLMGELTGEPAVMWGKSTVGFGTFRYRGKTSEGDWYPVGFAPRKQNLVLYLHCILEEQSALLSKLGKHKIGKSCLYINKLEDIHLPTLKKLIMEAYNSPRIAGRSPLAKQKSKQIMRTDMIASIHKATNYLSQDFLGGPRVLGFNWVINFQKGMTLFWVLGLMFFYENFSIQAWVYLALHGSYGLIWILKDMIFPDKRWQTKITFGGGFLAILTVLGPYWVAPYLLISPILGEAHVGANHISMSVAISMYAMGLTLMLTADAQKHYTLSVQKGLIKTGLFRFIRHPNYLGEMLIYGSFALLAWHWIPWVILAWVWLGYFSINIIMKERSMSRYEDWAEYKKRSWYLIPYIL